MRRLKTHHWLKAVPVSMGGTIGGLLGMLVYHFFEVYVESPGFYVVFGLCVSLGTSIQRMLQRAFSFFLFFEQLFELEELKKRGIINEHTYQKIVDELVRQRFRCEGRTNISLCGKLIQK